MCKQNQRHTVWGIFLIIMGGFFLMSNFRIFRGLGNVEDLFFAMLFAMAGLVAIGYALKNSGYWWMVFPGFVFTGIAGTLVADSIPFLRQFDGGIFLFSLSLAFWVVFSRKKAHWWAAIPGGILTTLAAVATLEQFTRSEMAGLFFTGLGMTFGVLWLIRHESRTDWAKWPALVLMGFGLFMPAIARLDRWWPLILIGVGSWVLLKNFVRKPATIPPQNNIDNTVM